MNGRIVQICLLIICFHSAVNVLTCVDKDPSCSGLAKIGECLVNPGHMLPNCQKSCGDCKGIKYQIYLETEQPPPICWDVSLSCKDWADKCKDKDFEPYMNRFCNVTCGVCGCKDKLGSSCPLLAKIGECLVNPGHMLPNCQKSCGDCDGIKHRIYLETPEPPPICWDVSPSCPHWVSKCKSPQFASYMNRYCNVTCGVCKP